ncbi:hypothetical protein pb186bvf_001198 [Paramecium bursaria]
MLQFRIRIMQEKEQIIIIIIFQFNKTISLFQHIINIEKLQVQIFMILLYISQYSQSLIN